MKTLLLLRHAKSSWNDSSLSDFDRPLAPRGVRDAPKVGAELRKRDSVPDLVISSPARRAKQTIAAVAEAAGLQLTPTFDERIYGASSAELMTLIGSIPDANNCVLLVGHNPGFEELLTRLSSGGASRMPTCALARLEFTTDHWADIQDGQARLIWLLTPKQLD